MCAATTVSLLFGLVFSFSLLPGLARCIPSSLNERLNVAVMLVGSEA